MCCGVEGGFLRASRSTFWLCLGGGVRWYFIGREGKEGRIRTAKLAVLWRQRADAAVYYILGRLRRGGSYFSHDEDGRRLMFCVHVKWGLGRRGATLSSLPNVLAGLICGSYEIRVRVGVAARFDTRLLQTSLGVEA